MSFVYNLLELLTKTRTYNIPVMCCSTEEPRATSFQISGLGRRIEQNLWPIYRNMIITKFYIIVQQHLNFYNFTTDHNYFTFKNSAQSLRKCPSESIIFSASAPGTTSGQNEFTLRSVVPLDAPDTSLRLTTTTWARIGMQSWFIWKYLSLIFY